ncbi:hypothetical protein A6046_05470 [[Haemophilus] ducreyi]|uniref:Uncharacterized protein n=2 Tax=Haemophilus ducreyi TaxID=730 RepID=Q7VL64_HAEDU|nr:hypothetical protein [[Haemophilus] ducreyi]AAP96395.1 hypothetical protein HD_1617 [[Haemophilus] ducreyi 35000HP]AKO31276.1 hypothetical protein RY60_06175 [[Haemophilus] ducreyi]AKO32723.1 hypothetical protein RZ57_06240 [[Haemophilus] ducreyi]AKO34172.1 hypothetical protein RZ58_06230 [[Haemophilus] ducreyi]AKO35616.1 hypothetical protein RZ59_06165 [[Haemophilus] ducreyi]
MPIFILIYAVGTIAIYQSLRRLQITHYMFSLLIILLASKGLIYCYPDTLSIQIIDDINSLFITLDVLALIMGAMYRFGYLKTRINNQAQRDVLPLMPAFALFPRILLYPAAKDIHDDFWYQYKNLK